jgi:hypothetical protein
MSKQSVAPAVVAKEYPNKSLENKLGNLNRQIRSLIPRRMWSEAELTKMPSCVEKMGYLNGRRVKRLIMVLTPVGCAYCLEAGGCFMCGEVTGSTMGLPIPASCHINQFNEQYVRMQAQKVPWMMLYNEGNIFNDDELSPLARNVILGHIIANNHERLTIESRPEYIMPQSLMKLREMEFEVGHYDSRIEIGIGLEVQDDRIRNYTVNKGFTRADFEKAVKLIKSNSMRALTYVLVKPPFLTEREAIEEAIKTAEYAFSVGSDAVSFELASIHEYTIIEYLRDQYRPPWLWSAIEIAKATRNLGEIRIGGEPDTYYPRSSKAAYNCAECTETIWKTLESLNDDYSFRALENLNCACKEEWKKQLNVTDPLPLEDRIPSILNRLSMESYATLKLGS